MPEESNQSKFENYSLNLDGSNQLIQVDNDLFGGLEKFSVSFWYNMSTVSGDRAVIGRWSLADAQILIYHQGSTGYWRILFVNNSGTSQGITTTFAATLNTWQFISFIYDGSNVSVQLNNEAVQSQASSGSIKVQTATPSFQIGADNSTRDFTGQLDQVCIFDYALSTDQRNYLYNSGTPQNPMAISGNAPIAYYPLGGSSTGSASTLTVPNESVPSATVFHFDDTPSNNLINLGVQSSIENSTSFTLNFWLNPSSFTSPYTLLGTKTGFSGDSAKGIAFDVRSTFLIIYLGDDFSNYARVNNPLPLNEWTLLSVVYDGSQSTNADKFKIYYGSTQQTVNTFGGTIPSTSPTTGRSLILGKQATGNCIETDVSNLTIFSSALQGSDITTLYNNGSPLKNIPSGTLTNDLTAWYKLNVDTSTWNGSNWIIGNSTANYTTALNFVQSETDYIELDNVVNLGTTWTISFWINTTQGLSSNGTILAAGSGNGFTMLLLRNNRLMLYRGAGADYNYFLTNGEFNDGEWHNIILVRNGTKDIIPYLDGNIGSYYFAAGSGNLDTNMKFIGDDGGTWGTATAFDGALSNIAFFDTALDASAVETIYNNGTPETSISSSPISWWKLNNLTTGIQDSVNSNNGTNNGATELNTLVSTLNGTSSNMTTANLVTSDLIRSIPYSSYSMVFDGTADYIDCGSDSSLSPSSFTFSVWSKSDLSSGAWVSKYASENYGFGISGGNIYLNIKTSAGWGGLSVTASSYLTADKWHNIVGTYNGTDLKIYVDGNLASTLAKAGPITYSSRNTRIGNLEGTSALDFNGSLSNVAIWNSELTQDQILTIYNGGVPNDISSLSPVSWWSLAGDSYYNGSNWICPDLGSGSNNGTSSGMGGTELVGDGPGSTANGVATSMDIPANLKGNAPNSSKNAFSVNMNSADRVTDVPA
jgi:hypothetical protein